MQPAKAFKRVPNQAGAPEGQVRWYCNGCMKSFSVQQGETPEACPEGHRFDGNGELVMDGQPEEAPAQ